MPQVSFLANETIEVHGHKMAYAQMGEGSPIVFLHGNATSSYLWRNIGPRLADYGRCVAVDLIGMGKSDKLPGEGAMRYTFAQHADFLYHALDQLQIYKDAIIVAHGWGAALGFEWAYRYPNRCAGIAYMEALVMPVANWEAWEEEPRRLFQALRSPAGEKLVLEDNVYIDKVLMSALPRDLGEGVLARYRAPFAEPGEGRRPLLDWALQVPIAGDPPQMARLIEEYSNWLARSDLPKLFIDADPGALTVGPLRRFCRTWANQETVRIPAGHLVPEDNPQALAEALVKFVLKLRR